MSGISSERIFKFLLLILSQCFFSSFPFHALAASSCDASQISIVIKRLKQRNENDIAFLKQCEDTAVVFVIKELQSADAATLSAAAYALYRIGPGAKDAAEPLSEILANDTYSEDLRLLSADAIQRLVARNITVNETLLQVARKDKQASVRATTITALGTNSIGETEVIEFLLNTISGQDADQIRIAATYALGNISAQYPEKIQSTAQTSLLEIIETPNINDSLTAACVYALDQMDANDETIITGLIKLLEKDNNLIRSAVAFALSDISEHLYNQANTLSEVGENLSQIQKISISLESFRDSDNPDIKKSIYIVDGKLSSLKEKRQTLYFDIAKRWIIGNRAVWLLHPLVWIALISAYPYPQSQKFLAVFFWNKYVRAVLGCWYVGPLITSVPFLRQRLFAPFKDSLLADADIKSFSRNTYFPYSNVKLKQKRIDSQALLNVRDLWLNKIPVIWLLLRDYNCVAGILFLSKSLNHPIQPLTTVFPEIKGQIILEGRSGLGKTMLLRYLASQTRRIIVYLPARKCEKGVVEAIQDKLIVLKPDYQFLSQLICCGALDIYIDGLNEVNVEVRVKIIDFVEQHFKGNIIMTTQPLRWEPPATAKTYELQPLRRHQIQKFLKFQQQFLNTGCLTGMDYEQACTEFIEKALNPYQPAEELKLKKNILSNPMDLSLIAQLISYGSNPNLFELQQQQYTLMAQDYENQWNQPFPINQFSKFVYQMRVNNIYAMTGKDFSHALSIMEMEEHRMVLSRQWQNQDSEPQEEWTFRHDKIMEFFLVKPFLGYSLEASEIRQKHIGDARFRGIYLLLARLLPVELALALQKDLINYAADTKDHTVSDHYVQILRSRQSS